VASEPTAADTATLSAVVDRLDYVMANGEREQAKALLGTSSMSFASTAETRPCRPTARRACGLRAEQSSGASRARTGDLVGAIHALSQTEL
jgi:hypothetical protein